MNEIAIVFAAEFMRRLRSRPFIIGTVLGMVFIFGGFQFGKLIGNAAGGNKNIVLSGSPELLARAGDLLAKDFTIVKRIAPADAAPTSDWLRAHHNAAALVSVRSAGDHLETIVYAADLANFPARRLRADLAPLNLALAAHLDSARVRELMNVRIDLRGVGARFKNAEAADIAQGVAYTLVMVLYLSIILNNQSVMASVAEEKTSRISELLVAMIDPRWLLAGKIAAGGALGLLQMATWALAAAASGRDLLAGGIPLSPWQIALLFTFFLIGYVSYAVISAAVASLINRTEDLGSVSFSVIMPMIIALLIANYALIAPAAPLVTVTSFVPLLAPFVMFTRSVVGEVPLWQVLLSIAISLATIVLLVSIAAKLYRIGLLLYGRPPKFGQILAVLRG